MDRWEERLGQESSGRPHCHYPFPAGACSHSRPLAPMGLPEQMGGAKGVLMDACAPGCTYVGLWACCVHAQHCMCVGICICMCILHKHVNVCM